MAKEGERLGTAALPGQLHRGKDLLPQAGYLRGGPTQGEACPCQECPHFIYSPSLT